MGNKVIQFTKASTSPQQLEVYRDISMISEKSTKQMNQDAEETTEYRVTKSVNVSAIFNSLHNIFHWMHGERILLPEFGSNLQKYLYEGITQSNQEQIVAEIRSICMKWEPRVNIVEVVNVTNVQDVEDNTIRLDINFTIPSLSAKQYTYSYYYRRTQ